MPAKKVSEPFERNGKWFITVDNHDGSSDEHGPYQLKAARQAKTRRENTIRRAAEERRRAAELEIPDFDGTVGWFLRVLGLKAKQVATGGDKEARNDLKALASAGLAARSLIDVSDAETRLIALEELVKSLDRQAHHAIGDRRPPAAVRAAAEPGEPLH
jgi:hypothetical protein